MWPLRALFGAGAPTVGMRSGGSSPPLSGPRRSPGPAASPDPHTQRAIGSTPGPLLTGSGSPHTLTQLAGTAGATGCSPRSGVGRDPDTERGSQQELADAASSTFRLGSERPGCALSARESPAFYYSARCARKRTRPPPSFISRRSAWVGCSQPRRADGEPLCASVPMSESPCIACMWQVVRTPHRYEATAKMGSRMSSPPGCKPFRPDESEEQASELIPRGQEQECEDRREAEAQVSRRAGRAEPGPPVLGTPGRVVSGGHGGSSFSWLAGWLCLPAPQAALVLRRCVPLECWPGLGARSMGLSTGSCTLAWEPGLIKYRTQRELSACRPSP